MRLPPAGWMVVAFSTRGGEERDIVEGCVPAIAPDGRELVYAVRGESSRILAVPIAGGTPRPVTT